MDERSWIPPLVRPTRELDGGRRQSTGLLEDHAERFRGVRGLWVIQSVTDQDAAGRLSQELAGRDLAGVAGGNGKGP